MKLEKPGKDRLKEVKLLHKRVFQSEEADTAGFDRYLLPYLTRKDGCFSYVLVQDDAIVAALWGNKLINTLGFPGVYLDVVMVAPEFQGMGYGKQLLTAFKKKCCQKGIVSIRVNARPDSPAFALYQKLGFMADELNPMTCLMPESDNKEFAAFCEQLQRRQLAEALGQNGI